MSDRADISLEEVFGDFAESLQLNIHTALPAIVKSYDPKTGRCDVQPAIKRALLAEDGSPVYESLPIIPNVRVCWPGAGGFELRFPLKGPTRVGDVTIPGDTVWLMFAEADIQAWESTGQESPPGWLERHGMSSLVAYPFSRTQPGSSDPAVASLPQIVAPDPLHVGNPIAAKLLAVAEKVDAAIDGIESFLTTHVHPAPGGATSPSGTPYTPASPTACTKLKAE